MDDFASDPARYPATGRSAPRAHAPRASVRPNERRPPPRRRALSDLRPLIRQGRYRIAGHAVAHAACEGFTERDIVATALYGRELARYPLDERLLVLGWLPVSAAVKIPLHVVLEYRKARWVDVVTAFIPEDPHRVVSRTRLAEVLRHDLHAPQRSVVGKQAG